MGYGVIRNEDNKNRKENLQWNTIEKGVCLSLSLPEQVHLGFGVGVPIKDNCRTILDSSTVFYTL